MGANTPAVTDASFAKDVLQSDKPVLVDFWAEWCGPCRLVAPVLEEIASQHGEKLQIVKLNVDENPQIARDYQVMSIPTMSVFQGGKIVKTIVGAKPKAALLKDLADYHLEGPSPLDSGPVCRRSDGGPALHIAVRACRRTARSAGRQRLRSAGRISEPGSVTCRRWFRRSVPGRTRRHSARTRSIAAPSAAAGRLGCGRTVLNPTERR